MLLLAFLANAQPGSGGFNDEPVDVPINGGIIFLGICWACLWLYKIRKTYF